VGQGNENPYVEWSNGYPGRHQASGGGSGRDGSYKKKEAVDHWNYKGGNVLKEGGRTGLRGGLAGAGMEKGGLERQGVL